MRLEIGSGQHCSEGFEPWDISAGRAAYPLDMPDGSVEEIRASHVLEHFPHGIVPHVLADWYRALKPNGRLCVAVPDFELIARAYLDGHSLPVQGYVMGGQQDQHDYHHALFDTEALTESLTAAGFIAVQRWSSDLADCASLPISLNLCAYKPPQQWPQVRAVLTVPRLGWNDMWGCTMQTCMALGIKLTKHTGAFWDQGITKAMDEALASSPEYLLTLDYDTVFSVNDVQTLIVLAEQHQIDAVAALQAHRSRSTPLLTLPDGKGGTADRVPFETFNTALTRARTAHFGCTLIRASALQTLPRPWFRAEPDSAGEWSDDRVDPDVSFWKSWERAGLDLYVANRVAVGHLETMIRWPGLDLSATWQHPTDYHANGKPEDVWR